MNFNLVSFLCILPCVAAFPVQVIEAEEGDDVLLECQQDAKVNLNDSLVEWSKDDHKNIVHVYRHGRDYLNDQKEEFKGRTVLLHEGLSRGNVALRLCSVRLSDSGTFRCYVKKLGPYRRDIILKVVQKGQNNPTQADDSSSTPLPVEAVTESNDPDGENMAAVYAGVSCFVALLCIAFGVALFKYGFIKRCMERQRTMREQKQEEAEGSEMEELNTSER